MAVWHRLVTNPDVFRAAMNVWPPFVGAGIVVDDIAPDYRHMRVLLKDRLLNRNYIGSHFGGSLFAMTDPFYMLMLIQILGPNYIVLDSHSEIDFVTPAYGTVHADFDVTEENLQRIRQATASGAKYEETFDITIKDPKNVTVAIVKKKVYVRLKPKYRPVSS